MMTPLTAPFSSPESVPDPVPAGSIETSSQSSVSGPRIKHVCRNAAVALGKPLATFPEKSELRLSALPTKDKVQLWKKDEQNKAGVYRRTANDLLFLDLLSQGFFLTTESVHLTPSSHPTPEVFHFDSQSCQIDLISIKK